MSRNSRYLVCLFCLLALLLLSAASCSSGSSGASHQATATGKSGKTPGGHPGGTRSPGSTVSPTSTNTAACSGKLSNVVVPNNAVPVGSTDSSGATISCMYRIPQDLKTLDAFFQAQMKQAGWALLSDTPEGPQAMDQEYFQGQSFATIILIQHGTDTHTTDVSIVVETSK